MKIKPTTIRIFCVACALALSATAGLIGCAGDQYHESTGEYVDDNGVTARVKGALGNDSTFKYPDVKVTTFKGTVQLSGFVDTAEQKDRAGSLARGVEGVHQVDNNITIKS